MKVKILFYELKEVPWSKKLKLSKRLFGYKDTSNNGKYTYERKGLLDSIEHIKPVRSAIIIKPKDQEKVLQVFKDCEIECLVIDSDIKSEFFQNKISQ